MLESQLVRRWVARSAAARRDAHRILAVHEASHTSRVMVLEDLLEELRGLPVDVRSYFEEATTCLRYGLLRAAVVIGWAGFISVLLEQLFVAYEADIRRVRKKWKFTTLGDLKESYTESALLDVAKVVGLIDKAELRTYQGQLGRRNQCAHPTLYVPSLNSALGFVDDMIRQAKRFI